MSAGGAEREADLYKELKSVDGKIVGHSCVECGRLSTAPHKEECSRGADAGRWQSANQAVSDWLATTDGNAQQERDNLVKVIATFAARCANEARLEALEQAAAKVETMKFAHGDSWHCFMAPSHEAEELAEAIRALKAAPLDQKGGPHAT